MAISVQNEALSRPLVLISGFIHDISDFMDQHPGGRDILQRTVGTDATAAFFGGIYDHSHAAHNVSLHFVIHSRRFCSSSSIVALLYIFANPFSKVTLANTFVVVVFFYQLLTTLRVGALHGGLEQVVEHALPPAQKLFIADATLQAPGGSTHECL